MRSTSLLVAAAQSGQSRMLQCRRVLPAAAGCRGRSRLAAGAGHFGTQTAPASEGGQGTEAETRAFVWSEQNRDDGHVPGIGRCDLPLERSRAAANTMTSPVYGGGGRLWCLELRQFNSEIYPRGLNSCVLSDTLTALPHRPAQLLTGNYPVNQAVTLARVVRISGDTEVAQTDRFMRPPASARRSGSAFFPLP